ncbi:hypothetical protein F5Y15DRAFT_385773 [Xylariaceae sp. FL0016]|nr:hypothetical protein F5Y15DRAFT_385773 [Xylariaceae sp. FL0016]
MHHVTETETWASIVPYITAYAPNAAKPEAYESVNVDCHCTICQERLRLPCWVRHSSVESDKELEDVAILPCGHIFSQVCISAWYDDAVQQDRTPTCPLCRFELVYPKCRHTIAPKVLPVELALRNPTDFHNKLQVV